MGKIRLLVTDIDDTLIPGGTDYLNPNLEAVIHKALDAGIHVGIATGRGFKGAKGVVGSLTKRINFITGNGAVVSLEDGRKKVVALGDDKLTKSLVEYARESGHDWVVQGMESVFYEKVSDRFLEAMKVAGITCNPVDDVLNMEDKITTLSFNFSDGMEKEYINHRGLDPFRKELVFSLAGCGFIDIYNKGASKGRGIKILQEHLGVGPEETAVFGDSPNDISMFSCAEYSYAVEGASKEVKNAAKAVIKGPEQGGLLKYIEDLLRKNGEVDGW